MKIILTLIILINFSACISTSSDEENSNTAVSNPNPIGEIYNYTQIDKNNIDILNKFRNKLSNQNLIKSVMSFEFSDNDSIILAEPTINKSESSHAIFHVKKDQTLVNYGKRSELAINYLFSEGDTVEYSWSFMLPKDFAIDTQNRWQIIGQWHDQPNKEIGETWNTYKGYNPPLSFQIKKNKNEPLKIYLTSVDVRPFIADPLNGKKIFTQYYVGDIILGKWYHIKVKVKWQNNDSGITWVDYDNSGYKQIYAGINMNNNYSHYLKLGLYRDPSIELDQFIYIKNITINRQ